MSVGNLAYLIMVLTGYAVFIAVLGSYWLASFLAPPAPKAKATTVSANDQIGYKRAA